MDIKSLNRNIKIFYITEIFRSFVFFLPIWVVYQSQFLDFGQIAFYFALTTIIEVVMQIPTGAFADLLGRKVSLAVGNFFYALALVLIVAFPSVWIMPFYAFAGGVGTAFISSTQNSIIFDSLKGAGQANRYSIIRAKASLLFQINGSIAIVFGSYMYQIWQGLPWIARAVVCFVGIFVSLGFVEPAVTKAKFKVKQFVRQNLLGFKEIFKNRYIASLSTLYILIGGIGFASQRFLVQPFMVEIGLDDIQRGWVAFAVKVSIGIVGYLIVKKKKLFEHRMFLLCLPLIMMLTLIPIQYISWPWVLVSLLGVGFISGNADVFLSPEVNKHIASSVRTTALSAIMMLTSLANAIIQGISGPIVENSSVGYFYQLLGIFAIFTILPLTMYIVIHKGKLKFAPEEIGD